MCLMTRRALVFATSYDAVYLNKRGCNMCLMMRRALSISPWAEGCPPLRQAMASGQLTGLASYHITANPDYRQLFPPGDEVTDGL